MENDEARRIADCKAKQLTKHPEVAKKLRIHRIHLTDGRRRANLARPLAWEEGAVIPAHRKMHPAKRMLAEFVCEQLPQLLKERGPVEKNQARTTIERMFRERHGWPKELDRLEEPGRPMRSNAWGWALHWLCAEGVTRKCSGSDRYELNRD